MDLKKVIHESLLIEKNKSLVLTENIEISDNLQYHIQENLTLTENVFRVYSKKYFELVNEVRELYSEGKIKLNEEDIELVSTDLGESIILEDGTEVYLDAPFIEEVVTEEDVQKLNEALHRGKKVKLNKPFRTPGGPKKFAVYVKNPKSDNVKKVTFGYPGLRVRNANPKAAKSFRARHKCDQKKDRTKAGYWACNVGRYAKQLGLKSSASW
jgi:uncharacterized cupin superfamily protein